MNGILQRKNAFLGYKKKKFKSRKIDIFPKGSTHGFEPIFQRFFYCFFFSRNISHKNVFYDILQQKNAFLRYKNKKFKKSKNFFFFFKGLTYGFGPKLANFRIFFFLANKGQENFFYYILDRENAFVGCKKKNFKKSKNWQLSKELIHGFGPKMANFLTFFFRQYRPGKFLLWYSRAKKRLSSG